MESVEFKEANTRLGPPAGETEESVRTIHAWAGRVAFAVGDAGSGESQQRQCVITKWLPTLEEKLAIAEGGAIWMLTWGATFAPTSMTAQSPFGVAEGHTEADSAPGKLLTHMTNGECRDAVRDALKRVGDDRVVCDSLDVVDDLVAEVDDREPPTAC